MGRTAMVVALVATISATGLAAAGDTCTITFDTALADAGPVNTSTINFRLLRSGCDITAATSGARWTLAFPLGLRSDSFAVAPISPVTVDEDRPASGTSARFSLAGTITFFPGYETQSITVFSKPPFVRDDVTEPMDAKSVQLELRLDPAAGSDEIVPGCLGCDSSGSVYTGGPCSYTVPVAQDVEGADRVCIAASVDGTCALGWEACTGDSASRLDIPNTPVKPLRIHVKNEETTTATSTATSTATTSETSTATTTDGRVDCDDRAHPCRGSGPCYERWTGICTRAISMAALRASKGLSLLPW